MRAAISFRMGLPAAIPNSAQWLSSTVLRKNGLLGSDILGNRIKRFSMVRRKRAKSSKHPQPLIERTTFQPYTVILAIANLLSGHMCRKGDATEGSTLQPTDSRPGAS